VKKEKKFNFNFFAKRKQKLDEILKNKTVIKAGIERRDSRLHRLALLHYARPTGDTLNPNCLKYILNVPSSQSL